MPSRDPRAVFEAFLEAVNGRDAAALGELVHPDFVGTYPQSGERTHGLENLCAIIEGYPGGFEGHGTNRVVGTEDRWVMTPVFTLLRVEGSGDTFTGVQRVQYPDGCRWHVLSLGEIRDGRIWRLETFFAPAFDPPPWRSPWVEVIRDPDTDAAR